MRCTLVHTVHGEKLPTMHILSSCERVRQMRGSFTAKWCPHVIADPVVNRTEGVFGDGIEPEVKDCTVKLSDFLVEEVHVPKSGDICGTVVEASSQWFAVIFPSLLPIQKTMRTFMFVGRAGHPLFAH